MFKSLFRLILSFIPLVTFVSGASQDDWRRRSVYQLMTDRFSRTDDTDNTPCDVLKYCNGTYKGLINHLDWIQDMGFTAVCLPCSNRVNRGDRFGLVLLPKALKELPSTAIIFMVCAFWGGRG